MLRWSAHKALLTIGMTCVLGGLAARAFAQEAAPPASTVTPSFAADEWLDADATIELTVSPPLAPGAGSFAVFLAETDVTPLFTPTGDKLLYQPGAFRLPAGESELVVHLVMPDEQWREIARIPIRVRTRGGFEKVSLDPKLALNNDGQVAEGHSPDENQPQRDTYQDLSANTGLTAVLVRSGWTMQGQLNAVGVSHRERALRFGEKGEEAPRFDLSDYLVQVEKGVAKASLGHVTFGGNRHLISGFGSRGVTLTARLGSRVDLSAGILHGTSIVGWSHLLGVDEQRHRVEAATLGIEAFASRPGALRLEATAMRGSVLPLTSFSQGAVNDAEKSRGWGLRLTTATPGQRARLEAGYTRSRFDNPEDPLLAQGADLVEVRETTRGARYVEASFDVLPAWAITPTLQSRLTAVYRHERVEPLYRSVATFVQADRSGHVVELQGTVGEVSAQVSYQRSHDNLDDIPSILETRNRDRGLSVFFPVAFVVGASSRPVWLPQLNYSYRRTHQKGAGLPENADARATFIPDQVSGNHGLGLNWQGGRWRLSYQLGRSTQDNRQPERENADNANLTHTVSVGFTPLTMVDVGLDLALERAENKEIDRTDRTRRVGANLNWRATGSTSIGGRWSTTRTTDDDDLRERDGSDVSAEVSQRLDVFRIAGWPLPGQFFFRFGRQSQSSEDREFDFADSRRNWNLNTGLNLSMF